MDLTRYATYARLEETFDTRNKLQLLKLISVDIENSTSEELFKFIFFLFGKWPTCRNREMLVLAARRGIQAKYYVNFYDIDASKSVKEKDASAITAIGLSDVFPTTEELELKARSTASASAKRKLRKQIKALKEVKAIKESPIEILPIIQATKPKVPKSNLEVSEKIKTLELPAIIEWALQVGVPQENIDKHKNKSLGLAKMNLGNLIRGRVRKE